MAIKQEVERMISLADQGITYDLKDVTEILVVREPRGPREIFRIKFLVGSRNQGMWEYVRDESGRPALFFGNEGLQGALKRQKSRDLSIATDEELKRYRDAYEKHMTQRLEKLERERAKELGVPLASTQVQRLNLADLAGDDLKRAIRRCAEVEPLREFIDNDTRKSFIKQAERRLSELNE